jgi:hypothetical protein
MIDNGWMDVEGWRVRERESEVRGVERVRNGWMDCYIYYLVYSSIHTHPYI